MGVIINKSDELFAQASSTSLADILVGTAQRVISVYKGLGKGFTRKDRVDRVNP